MIIGVLGKGGSGKTTFSTRLVLHLNAMCRKTLAIDADHNMDLSYNLSESFLKNSLLDFKFDNYVGSSLEDLLAYLEIDRRGDYRLAFTAECKRRFSIFPFDEFTSKYSLGLNDNLNLMLTGPHNYKILFDQSCSHSLITPLKVFLPLLNLSEGQFVIVDEKAGADGVGTGITTGMDICLIVVEPSIHSIKVAVQLSELLDFFKTDYEFVLNKVNEKTDLKSVRKALPKLPIIEIPQAIQSLDFTSYTETQVDLFDSLLSRLLKYELNLTEKSNMSRFLRTKEKFENSSKYNSADALKVINQVI